MAFSIIRWIILVLILLFSIIYWHGGLLFIRERLKFRIRGKPNLPNILNLIMILLGYVSYIIDILLCVNILQPLLIFNNLESIVTGLFLFTTGLVGVMVLRFIYLKKNWSSHIKIFPEKNMIRRGLYRFIRHPIYFFSIFFFSGSYFIFPTLVNSIIIILILIGYVALTKVEDDFLRTNLDFYTSYAQHVRFRFIPFIW